jgi:hypothetical protein
LLVAFEADGIYVFHRGGKPLPSFPVGAVVDGTMLLHRVEVAVADSSGVYRVADRAPVQVERGQSMRVSLYWEALRAPQTERTVSVRIALPGGPLLAQQDNMPGQGKKPTSWWQEGWQIRDVYYLTVSSDASPGVGSLDVLVYDSHNAQVLPFDGDRPSISLCDVQVVDAPLAEDGS